MYFGSRTTLLAAFFVCVFLSAVSSASVLLPFIEGKGIVVRYDPALRNAAVEVARAFPETKSELESLLGWRVDFVPQVVLVRRHAQFVEIAGSGIFTAYALPARNLIVIDYSRMGTALDLRSTTRHELCHLLLHARIRTDLPRWLDEGVAQWASGGTSEMLYPSEKDILKEAVLSGHLIPLRDLSRSFPSDPRGTFLAYEESRSFVEFVNGKYGAQRFLSFLDALSKGRSPEESSEEAFKVGLSDVERSWRQGLLKKYTWPMYLSDHLYWILFGLAGLVTLLGYLRLKRRMSEYRDDDVEEEREDHKGPDETD